MTTLLAFDTSTEAMAIGLHAGGGRCHVLNADGGALASAALLPGIRRLLADAGVVLQDLDAVAFGAGPGAFTGLRISCAVAQGLGFGLGVPLLAIDSLLVVADDAGADDVAVVMDARMGEVYGGRYRRDRQAGGAWQTLQAPALYPLPAVPRLWQPAPPTAVAGSALAAFGDRLGLPDGSLRRVASECDRASALLRLALAAFHSGAGVAPADAAPLYLRDKVAATTVERAAAKAGAT